MKPMKRREFIKRTMAGAAAGLMGISSLKPSPAYGRIVLKKPVNLLYILTDQQRFDTLSCAGSTVMQTPNLDNLASQGVRFENAYSPCPVCVPCRTSVLTGHTIEKTQVRSNSDAKRDEAVCPQPSYDNILANHGYSTEYHGKFHSPLQLAYDYKNAVTAAGRGDTPLGIGMTKWHKHYLDLHVPYRDPVAGEQCEDRSYRPYTPNPFDDLYGDAPMPCGNTSGSSEFGCLEIPAEHSRTAFTCKEGIAVLERRKNGPFSVHISIGPPHSPFIPTEPYNSAFNPAAMPIPGSIDDPMTNSPYSRNSSAKYGDDSLIGYFSQVYYALCKEVDDWVGNILAKLDEIGQADNTLVIFTSDHGEMLGSHGMSGKGNFYEESAHIPLIMRLPGVIPAGMTISDPVSQIDMFATILDYLDVSGYSSQGHSLRPVIEGSETRTYCCSEWKSDSKPGFMVRTLGWKFMFGRSASASSLNALYDLTADPLEMNNLLGSNPDKSTYVAQAEVMRAHLVEWLTAIDSPHLQGVIDRAI